MAWSVESLPSNPAGWIRFPMGSRVLILYPGIECVSFACVLSCVVSGGGPAIVLTTDLGKPALVYLSSILVHKIRLSYWCLIHRHFSFL